MRERERERAIRDTEMSIVKKEDYSYFKESKNKKKTVMDPRETEVQQKHLCPHIFHFISTSCSFPNSQFFLNKISCHSISVFHINHFTLTISIWEGGVQNIVLVPKV